MKHWDDDARQEYELALLEGCDPIEATRRGQRGCDEAHSRRSHWVSKKPTLLFAGLFDWTNQDPRSLTQEERRDADGDSDVARLLDLVTPAQRRVLELRYGFETGVKETYLSIATMLGYTKEQHAWNIEQRALARIRRELAKPSFDDVERQRRERKREYNRKFMARKRAEAKVAA